MIQRCFCSVVTESHLPYARALFRSLSPLVDPAPYYVLVADVPTENLPQHPNIRFLALAQLSHQPPEKMKYYFDAFEFTNALKPFLISHLLGEKFSQVAYLDSDLLIMGSFESVWEELGDRALLLTPHHLDPAPTDLAFTNEIEIVDQGMLNGGFSAWNHTVTAHAILAWMRDRFPRYGFCDRMRGMFVDQKLLPLLMLYFPDQVVVSRHPGLNVAFWNFHERALKVGDEDRLTARGHEVVFWHFAGYRLTRPSAVCSYLSDEANAEIFKQTPALRVSLGQYHRALETEFGTSSGIGYHYSRFEGVVLHPELRRLIFTEGKIDRSTWRYWRIQLIMQLKLCKRWLIGLWRRNS